MNAPFKIDDLASLTADEVRKVMADAPLETVVECLDAFEARCEGTDSLAAEMIRDALQAELARRHVERQARAASKRLLYGGELSLESWKPNGRAN